MRLMCSNEISIFKAMEDYINLDLGYGNFEEIIKKFKNKSDNEFDFFYMVLEFIDESMDKITEYD